MPHGAPSSEYDYDQPRLPGKTVYILGAGFSKELGLPLISSFIPEGLDLLKKSAWQSDGLANNEIKKADADLLPQMRRLLSRRLPMLRALGGDEPSIEDVFCMVDLLNHPAPNGAEGSEPDRHVLEKFVRRVCDLGLERHSEALVKVKGGLAGLNHTPLVSHVHFKNVISEGSSRLTMDIKDEQHQQVCAYSAFLSQVLEGAARIENPVGLDGSHYEKPAIISLNYDLVIETKVNAFKGSVRVNYGKGVVDSIEKSSEGDPEVAFRWLDWSPTGEKTKHDLVLPLLKLHGSINWTRQDAAEAHRTPHSVAIQSLKSGKAVDRPSPLIFPSWQRDPLAETVFDKVLQEARIHLRLASRIVVIGYSMPPTDRYIRYLLADALDTPEQPALDICNGWGREESLEKVRSMFGVRIAGSGVGVYPGGFLEYVSAQRERQLLL